jgi:peptide/nickel transport system ATP-binding protein
LCEEESVSSHIFMSNIQYVLEAKALPKAFTRNGKPFVALEGANLAVFRGETLAIVGESGWRKTALARMLLRLIEPDSGEIYFEGRDLLKLGPQELRAARREMQMVFQDPFASLNPRMRVEEIVQEPVPIHEPTFSKDQRETKSAEILKRVGLAPTRCANSLTNSPAANASASELPARSS